MHVHVYLFFSGPGNGAVRLFKNGLSSTSYSSGIVQVYYNGQWGNICNDLFNFDYNGATVLCHQLGYTGVSDYLTSEFQEWAVACHKHANQQYIADVKYIQVHVGWGMVDGSASYIKK